MFLTKKSNKTVWSILLLIAFIIGPFLPSAPLAPVYADTGTGLPDLTVTSVTAPANVTAGQPATVTATVYNAGSAGIATPFTVTLNAKLSGGDYAKVGNQTVSSLTYGNSTGVSFSWTPASAGTYSLQAVADSGAVITEADEGNNDRVVEGVNVGDATTGTTPPAFTAGYPQATGVTTSGCDLAIQLDEPGTACYKVVADGADPGTDYAGWTAVNIPGADAVSTTVYGLTPGAAYDLYVIARDAAGNLQATPVKLDVTTLATDLGYVKVRVADNVPRLASDLASIDPSYRQPFGEILPPTEVPITRGLTVRGALEQALATKNITVYGAVDYVSGIGPVTSADGSRTVDKLSEFDSGTQSGWMVSLNGWFINAGANTFTVKAGDAVEWLYTCSLGADLGADFNNPGKTLKSLSIDRGILTPAFSPQTMNYTLTLPAATAILVTPTAANRNNKVTIQSGGITYRPQDPITVADQQAITVTCAGNTYTVTITIASSDQDSANAVIALITALPAVDAITTGDRAQIQAARTAYDSLTGAQQALVADYTVLTAAEAKIAQLDGGDQAAAATVTALITTLPAVDQLTLDNQAQVQAARSAYNALTAVQQALVTNLGLLTAAEARIAVLLNPGASMAQNYVNDFLLSALDLEMTAGDRKEIVILDTPRVGDDDQAFNRDDLIFNIIKGSDIVAVDKENPDGTPKGIRYYVRGLKEGVAEISITYPGYRGQDAVIAVNVKGTDTSGPALTTDIGLTKYDILYFTGDSLDYSFNVTTDPGATVTASVYGSVYGDVYGHTYTPDNGRFTVNLKDGYNPIVLTANGAGGTTTKVYNLRAKKMAVALANLTRPGSQEYYEGDILKISFTGLVIPVPKVSRIYNPAAVGVTYSCSLPRYSITSGSFSQYGLSTDNGMQIELTGAGDCALSGGHIDENWFGSGLYSEAPVGTAPPVTSASQTDHRFSVLPDVHLAVQVNPNYHPQLFTANIENTEDIWPGDKVTITIPDLDTAKVAADHPPANPDAWMTTALIDSYTTYVTDIPGLATVKSGDATKLTDLDYLKTITFTLPADTVPGTYTLKGGYVWVKYGPSWWVNTMKYFIAQLPDIAIEVKEPAPGRSIIINNAVLKNKLAIAAGKPDGYSGNLTREDLEGITGPVDLSNAGITDADMAYMQYLKGVSAINLSNNPALTGATVKAGTFDWTIPKSLNFSGCTGITAIAAQAFQRCANLTSITLPEGVASLGDYCFQLCTGLTSVTLPDTVASLGTYCFSNCSRLTSVTLPEGVQSIGTFCFPDCSALTSINLPDTLTTLPTYTFYNDTLLANIKLPAHLQSIGDQCFSFTGFKTLVLPDTVTALGQLSFNQCKELTSVTLPKNLQSMGSSCFSGCHALLSITLPQGLTSIPDSCFNGCTALAGVNLPDSLTTLGSSCFKQTALTGITLPARLTTLGISCFAQMALMGITLPAGITQLPDTCFQNDTQLTYLAVPAGVTSIGTNCFSGCAALGILDLRAATVFKSTSSIGSPPRSTMVLFSGADAQLSPASASFQAGETLTITTAIPAGKTVVWGSGNPAVATVASGVVTGVHAGTAIIAVKASDNSYSGICQVTVTDLDAAKLQALSLSGITLNETFDPARYIYTAAVAGDMRSTTVTARAADEGSTLRINDQPVADGVPSGSIALNVGANPIQVKITSADGTVTKTYTITVTMKAVYEEGGGYVAIGNQTLKNKLGIAAGRESGYAGNLTLAELAAITGTLDLSNSDITDNDMAVMKYLKDISAVKLSGNDAITSASVIAAKFDWTTPKSLDLSRCAGITGITNSAFQGCTKLTEIILPDTLTSLGDSSFCGCTSLTRVVIPDGVANIGIACFQGCTGLTSIKLPQGIVSLPNSFFSGCTGLTEIELPASITSLGASCFQNTKLTHLAVPAGVTSIGTNCFSGCAALGILDLRAATVFKSTSSIGSPPSSTVVLFSGADARLSPASGSCQPGGTLTITTAIPAGKTVVWGSGNTAVATVANGVVIGMHAGTAIIAAKASDNSYSGICTVTVAAADTAPPSFTTGYPQATSVTATGCGLAIKLDEPGTACYKLLPAGTQITPGDGQTVAQAVYLTADGSVSIPGTDTVTATISGLNPGAAYDLYVIAMDTAGNLQTTPVRLSFTAASPANSLITRVRQAIAGTTAYVQTSGYLSDWIAVGLRNAGAPIPDDYLANMAATVDDYFTGYVNTTSEKVTDHERRTLGVVAAGGNPRDIGGHDLLDRIYNFYITSKNRDITFQGLNGPIYGLIALDSMSYQIPANARYSRDYLINYLLSKENSDGGWDLSASGHSDVDITAMTLIGLAPYHSKPDVMAAINRGVAWLSQKQSSDGGYASWGASNSESISQTVIALCANGIDPASEEFTKNGHTTLDALLAYQQPDGSIWHTLDGSGSTGMSTEQGYQALLAYDKYVKAGGAYNDGRTSIYHFEDITPPQLAVTGLTDGQQTNSNTVTFTVVAEDNKDASVTLLVKLNQIPLAPVSGNTYTAALAQGDNSIEISAADAAGNSTTQSYTVRYTAPPVQNSCDLNGDGRVNVQDLVLVGQHIAETGAPGWIPEDINKDGRINVQDLVLVGQSFTS